MATKHVLSDRPLVVAVGRGGYEESRHAVDAILVDAAGGVVARWGQVERPVFPRSAVKPLQTVPLVASGAADAQALGAAELSIACASHGGEPRHVAVVEAWLQRLGLGAEDLACGAHWPMHDDSARDLAVAGERPRRSHNNCSGEHAGMLAICRHLGEAVDGYERAEHPAQRRIAAALDRFCGVRTAELPVGVDGCSAPTWALPLAAMALGLARWGVAALEPEACRRLRAAIVAEPLMLAGTGRLCSAVAAASGGRVIAKGGAEGVYAAALPEAGLGLALKVQDGARRAAEAALVHLLAVCGISGVEACSDPVITNWRGTPVGRIAVLTD